MRTTLDVDDDLLVEIKNRARREKRSVGAVVSQLVREALTGTHGPAPTGDLGFAVIAPRDVVVSTALVDQLIEESGE